MKSKDPDAYVYVVFFFPLDFGYGKSGVLVCFYVAIFCLSFFFLCARSVSHLFEGPFSLFGLEQKSRSWKMTVMHSNSCYSPYATFISVVLLP